MSSSEHRLLDMTSYNLIDAVNNSEKLLEKHLPGHFSYNHASKSFGERIEVKFLVACDSTFLQLKNLCPDILNELSLNSFFNRSITFIWSLFALVFRM